MKITKTVLKQIIKEEYSRLVSEARHNEPGAQKATIPVGQGGHITPSYAARVASSREREKADLKARTEPLRQLFRDAHKKMSDTKGDAWINNGTELRRNLSAVKAYLNQKSYSDDPKVSDILKAKIEDYVSGKISSDELAEFAATRNIK